MNDEGFDIAVSCTEERRSYVEEVVEACKQRGMTVFYDRDKTNEWWLGGTVRDDVAGTRVRRFVPVISTEYLAQPSPTDEFSTAMMQAVKLGDGNVLPVLMGDGPIPAELLHPHVDYLRGTENSPEQVADRLAARVSGQQQAWTPVADIVLQVLESHTVPDDFSRYAAQDETLRYLGEQFQAAEPTLRSRGFVGTVLRTEPRVAVRIERRGETVFALDIQRGGIGGDETINFVVGRHSPFSACTNGWARPVYDKTTGQAVLSLHDLSLLNRAGADARSYTNYELFAALWERITAQLEEMSG